MGVLLALLLLLPWWPGGDRGFDPPDYARRVPVVNTLNPLPNLRESLEDWNACGADIRLVPDQDVEPYAPGSITITHSDDPDMAFGGVTDTYGVVLLAGGWSRTINVISHEVGHALGFGHNNLTSVMGNGDRVSPVDCEGLRNYYGT